MNILILCTGNSARSILGEAVFNVRSGGRITAFSAGSKPTGCPHPLAIQTLMRHDIDPGFASSKSWTVFEGKDAPIMDALITVCDSAASESCPIWPGAPIRAHWGLPDPAAVSDPDAAVEAFEQTFQKLCDSVDAALAHPNWRDGGSALKTALDRARPR